MYRKRKSRVVATLLAAMLFALTACGGTDEAGQNQNQSTPESDASKEESKESSGESVEAEGTGEPDAESAASGYPIEGGIKLTYADGEHTHVTAISQLEDTPFWQAWQDQTGITLEYQMISDFTLLLASGEYPDIISSDFSAYNGGIDGAIADGIIVPIDDYMDTLASDYAMRLATDENWAKGAKTPNGHYPGFYHIRTDEPGISNNYGLIARKDWLDDLNMEIPATREEFEEMLRAFKEQKGAISPLSVTTGTLKNMGFKGLFTSPFGLVCTDYYHTDGIVHYGAYEPEYKDYLAWLNSLYKEGLLDPNFSSLDGDTEKANIMNGISGTFAAYAGGGIGVCETTARGNNPEYTLCGISSLVENRGELPMFSQRDPAVPGTCAVITTSCKDVEAAVRFLNYAYTEEGNNLFQFGIEGESFEMVDGAPKYTEKVLNSPDSIPFTQAIGQYAFTPNHGPYIQGKEFCVQSYNESQNAALLTWPQSDYKNHYVPPLSVAAESATRYSTIRSEVDTYVSENFVLFVSGEKSLDEFDSYLETLKGMGIEDMISIYQAAFDVYNR